MSQSHGNSSIVHATEFDFDSVIAKCRVVLVKFGAQWVLPPLVVGCCFQFSSSFLIFDARKLGDIVS
jgi:hypothetical protein